jgi:hypothetical protein
VATAVTTHGEWLVVSTAGFAEQQRGRPFEHLVKELVQNALDGVDGNGRIELTVTPKGRGRATVQCRDNGSGSPDLSRLNIVFDTDKKDGVTKRGRMGRGFKELLCIARSATVQSWREQLDFSIDQTGRRQVSHTTNGTTIQGFSTTMDVDHEGAGAEVDSYFASFLVPVGVSLTVNERNVPHRAPAHIVEARLTTERFVNGRWEKPQATTKIHLVPTASGESPLIYEMGIPVCGIEWDQPFHCDIQQRVPMNPNRDAVMQGYAAKLHRACLATLLPAMTTDHALAGWVGEAAGNATEDVQREVVTKAFGANVVRAVPTAGRFDHNSDAAELGRTVVHTAHMPPAFRSLLQKHTPTAATVSREVVARNRERAVQSSLDRDDVLAIASGGGKDIDPALRKAILHFGPASVAARMDFARWFVETVGEERRGDRRSVPVRVANIDDAQATWSESGILTLSLGAKRFWSEPVGRTAYALLLHEMAHEKAFHHGSSFPHEVEQCAGAAVVAMMRHGDEALQRFPWLKVGPERDHNGTTPVREHP